MPAKKKTEVVAPVVQETLKAKRTFRPVEERVAEIDKKILFHQKAIEQLESRKAKIGTTGRRQRKLSYARVFADLKASGKTPEEIAELLNK